jgi:hypothetical protein
MCIYSVSDFNPPESRDLTYICSKGKYSVLYVSLECVMILQDSLEEGVLVAASPIGSILPKEIVVYVGYLTTGSFNVLKRHQMTLGENNCRLYLSCSEALILDQSTNISIQECSRVDTFDSSWRLVYPGQQTDICILRKFEHNFLRELDISVLIEPAHRMIVDCLRTAILNGLKMTFGIKSKPFKFYLPLIQTASCIFMYSNV